MTRTHDSSNAPAAPMAITDAVDLHIGLMLAMPKHADASSVVGKPPNNATANSPPPGDTVL